MADSVSLKTRLLRAFVIVSLFASQMPAQQPAPPAKGVQSQVQESTGTATFTANTQLVVEQVTVKGKDGNSVEGLKKENFTVTEDNKPQEIKFFEYEKLDDVVAAPEPALKTERTPDPAPLAKLTRTQIAPEPKGTVQYKNRRLLAIYFDMASMQILDQLHALDAASAFVKKNMSPADLVAIMQYNGAGVEVLQDFTGDKDKVLTIIATLVAGEADNTGETDTSAAAADTGAAFGQDDSEFNVFNTDRQLAALQTATKMLGSLNEKKSLIYFASGMNLNGTDNQAQLTSTVNDAIRSGVSFWPIDARGLVATSPLGSGTQRAQGGAAMYTGQAALAQQMNFAKSQDTLYTLASDTGGKAMIDFNDLQQGIVNAEKAISSYYIIGYYTTNDTPDGKQRRVKITLNNGVQASLEYRQVYYANKVWAKFTTADKERQLEDALMAGDPITELTMALEVNYFRQNHAESFVPIMLKIPGSELALAKKGGAEHTLIDFIGEIKDDQGSTIQNIRDYQDIKLTDATAAEWVKRPIAYDTGYNLLPGPYKIKVLARDSATGRMGTYIGSFTVPNLDKDDTTLPISSVVLSSQRASMAAAIANVKGQKAAATQAVDPLVQDGYKLIPSVTRVFHTSNDMYVYLEAAEWQLTADEKYQRDQSGRPLYATAARPLVAYVSFFRNGVKVMETPAVKTADGLDPKSGMIPIKLAFGLDRLKPGEYNCEVTVLDPTTKKAAFWQAPVMMIP
ncbi:MAG TPA: VWA domain-containing protein [Bryobacteraceae bacterium]|nr:VWA domain-containing protein [Bryobacteraceae bacterium]